jgi:hypothetical protein
LAQSAKVFLLGAQHQQQNAAASCDKAQP